MSETWTANLDLVELRWPSLATVLAQQDVEGLAADLRQGRESTLYINGIQLGSRHDRAGEARLQADSLGEKPEVHLYGPGLGDLPQAFLARPGLRQLHVHLLNEQIFALVLHLLDQSAWLGDPRVSLALASDEAEIRLPFFASPPELVLASDTNAKIRDRLVAEIGVPFANSRFVPDDPALLARLADNRELLQRDGDVAALFDSRPACEAWVIATGPTLAGHYERLRTARQTSATPPLLIAVDTALRPLLENGVRPDFVVSIDQMTSSRTLCGELAEGLPLIYFPLLAPDLLAAWPGPRYAAYSASPIFDGLRRQIPKGSLFADGSVLHPAVDLAVRMGARQIVLFGADFAFVGDQAHAGWAPGELAPTMETAHWVLNGHGQRVKTLLNLRGYLCSLERYIAARPTVRFLNTSREGAWIAGTHYEQEGIA